MKNKPLFYLFLSFFAFSLASCSSDDDNGPIDVSILGKWNMTQMTMEGDFSDEGISVTFDGVANSLPGNDITFHADNTVTSNSAPFNMQFTYLIDGVPFEITQPISSELTSDGTWRQEGNNLFFKETGSVDEQQYTIVTLNGSTLKLSADQDNIDMGSDFPNGRFLITITMSR